MRPVILVICSWLNIEKNSGIFFREQAKLVDDFYEPILVTFSKTIIGLRNVYKVDSFFNIKERTTPEGLTFFECEYCEFLYVHMKFNEIIQSKLVDNLTKVLKLKNKEISIVHAQSLFDASFWAYLFHKKNDIPYITTEHNPLCIGNLSIKNYDSIFKVLNNSSYNLVVSHDLIRQFAINGLFYDFIVVGNFVSEEVFSIKSERTQKSLHLVTNGAYTSIKDQKTILDALLIIDQNGSQVVFTWIGYNSWGVDNELEVKSLIDSYGYRNIEIRLVPQACREKVSSILNEADVFLLSSISETFNVSVLEALACGLPVITTQCGGINETITNQNGFIVNIKDSFAMADMILGFIDNRYVFNRAEISKNAISRFGSLSFKNRMLTIYDSAIKNYQPHSNYDNSN